MSDERIWQVILPDGSAWIAPDSYPDNPRASWIYARATADMFARQLNGEVVEVTRRQKEKLLDKEIATTLAKPRSKPLKPRPLARADRAAIAEAVIEHGDVSKAGRTALKIARETEDQATYKTAIATLAATLPATLWVGRLERDRWGVQEVEPVWSTEDPDHGEDRSAWRQIERDAIALMLVEDM